MNADDQIILLLQKRDEEGIRQICGKYGASCRAVAYRILGKQEDAEECFSDALLMIWNRIPPDLPENLQAYLITLVRRCAIDRLRTDTRQKRGGAHFAESLDELAEILPSSEYVESEVKKRELIRALNSFLSTLKPEVRHLLMQRYYFAMPLQAIADRNGMHLSSVKMTLLRTRNKLRDYLKKEGLL